MSVSCNIKYGNQVNLMQDEYPLKAVHELLMGQGGGGGGGDGG